MPALNLNSKLKNILAAMSIEDKVSLVTGKDFWSTVALPQHNIGTLKVSDGPVGVRGDSEQRVSSVSLPCPAALGATWNTDLLYQAGDILGEECTRKAVSVLLGPTINLQRTPIGGRNFECYAEDPFLTAELAVQMVNGVQSHAGVGACIKHFICNDQEFDRHNIDITIDEQTLREMYLYPFEQVIARSKPWAVMSSYNRVNGKYTGSSNDLLNGILKTEWQFDGFVVSDWFAKLDSDNYHRGALGGQDLEMPGPTRDWGEKLISACAEHSDVMQAVDDKVGRLLTLLHKADRLNNDPLPAEQSIDKESERQFAKFAACQSTVLLKNDHQLLPLNSAKINKLAVIGPAAFMSQTQGGGSAKVIPHRNVSLMDGIQQFVNNQNQAEKLEVNFAQGCLNNKWVPMPDKGFLTTQADNDQHGLLVRMYADTDCQQQITARNINSTYIYAPNFQPDENGTKVKVKAMNLQGYYAAESSGTYEFGLMSSGYCRLLVDGKMIIDNFPPHWQQGEFMFERGSQEQTVTLSLQAHQQYLIEMQFERTHLDVSGIRLGIAKQLNQDDLLQQAIQLASQSDSCILALGTSDDWESEGSDRTNMNLPGLQNQLATAILAIQPNTVIVMNAAAPVSMPWLEQTNALLWTWFGGQEYGHAVAQMLFGTCEPSGRLPLSFPARIEDSLIGEHYPGTNGTMHYSEKNAIGYRWYLSESIEPLFWFGYGLSYSKTQWQQLVIQHNQPKDNAENFVKVALNVKNIGDRLCHDVVQVYIQTDLTDASQIYLAGFVKLSLQAGELQAVSIDIHRRSFCRWNSQAHDFVLVPGSYRILVGRSVNHIEFENQIDID